MADFRAFSAGTHGRGIAALAAMSEKQAKRYRKMAWLQREVQIPPLPKGCHSISRRVIEALPELKNVKIGQLHIFIQHTSASLTINENADPDVVRDLAMELNKVIPFEDGYHHREGNAAAHIKSSIVGSSVQVIVERGDLVLGTWQGIFFAEFDGPRSRQVHLQLVAGG